MIIQLRLVKGFLSLLSILFLILIVSCQSNSTPETGGVLNGAPSILEALGTIVPTPPPLPTSDPELAALGKEVYDLHCAVCHGANLEGQPEWQTNNPDGSFRAPPHDEAGHTWHHSDRSLIDSITRGGARLPAEVGGTSAMPAYENVLTGEEITAVLAYIKSTWPEEIRQIQWERTAADPVQ